MGAARLRVPVFVLFNVLGSITFVTVYLTLGYLFGETIEDMLGRVRPYERWIIFGLLLLGALIWAVREWRLYHSKDTEVEADDEAQ
jgi:membrane protein DedA with SNARE-associated domain